MKKSTILVATAAILIAISGCSTLKPRLLDSQTGYFPTSKKLTAESIVVKKEFNSSRYLPLLYVKTDEKNKKYNDFFLLSFVNMKKFAAVYDKKQLEQLIIEKNLTDKVTSISDLIGLRSLQKQIGNFLVVEPYVEFKGAYSFEAELKAIDPETGETVLQLTNKAFNWAGLDQPLFYPLLNGFLDWVNGKEISIE